MAAFIEKVSGEPDEKDIEQLEKLTSCDHLKEFYKLVSELKTKNGLFSSSGSAKAARVMSVFSALTIEQRLNPTKESWKEVSAALQLKRGFFTSSSFHAFKKHLKEDQTHSQSSSNPENLDEAQKPTQTIPK